MLVQVEGGHYADVSPVSRCQVFHVCGGHVARGGPDTVYSFLCPNGTVFSQDLLVCDWWFNVDCHQDRA